MELKKFCCDCVKFTMFKKDGNPSNICKIKDEKVKPLQVGCIDYRLDKRIKTIL